jgi:diadenosine tetraphosphate (Ap4A) HIT family hydrolase
MSSDNRHYKTEFPSLEHGIPIMEFKHWNIYLHPNQCYLGRYYLWARRSDAVDLMNTSDDEWLEFREIGQKLKEALDSLFSPNRYNYAALGNVGNHLHVHFIPRYATPRVFQSMQFVDSRWGQNFAPYNKSFSLGGNIRQAIADSISEKLRNIYIGYFEVALGDLDG